MIPSINTWYYLEQKKPNIGDIVIGLVDNDKCKIENFPRYAVVPIIFNDKGFFAPFSSYRWSPLEYLIVWQQLPKVPNEYRSRDPSLKGKCYSHNKFFDTREEMIEYSAKWIDLPFDYEEFCNQAQMMLGAVILNHHVRLDKYTNREAYEVARIQMGWGRKEGEL